MEFLHSDFIFFFYTYLFLSSSFVIREEHPQLLFEAALTSSPVPSQDTSAKKNIQQKGATTCCKQPDT